jgi:hypothetical protein
MFCSLAGYFGARKEPRRRVNSPALTCVGRQRKRRYARAYTKFVASSPKAVTMSRSLMFGLSPKVALVFESVDGDLEETS